MTTFFFDGCWEWGVVSGEFRIVTHWHLLRGCQSGL